jgi:hypothetical protein
MAPSQSKCTPIGQRRLSPEVLKAIRRQFGVAHGVLDIPVAEVSLKGSRIVALIRKGEAAGVP